ncbi:hypothetical protein [Haloferula sargassicola]|uniref:Uncharacterized protein n=1 Tax=Haloferula sargassicola TaxID=490096 RepID=A0ABP9UQ04_9BACT
MRILHQCGHNAVWNRTSFTERGDGDGLILSPVHERISQVESYDPEIKRSALFDPQFYLPNSQKNKLQEYEFFPDVVAQGFQTSTFEVRALDAARQCIDFQLEQEFERVVIPARFFGQMVTDYCQRQEAYSVVPHLTALGERNGHDRPIYLTLPVTTHMVSDQGYRMELLNWATSYPEIDGIYLIVSDDRNTKQVCNGDVMFEILSFVRELRLSGLKVLVGYCNSESLLFSLIKGVEVTFGAYENTRIFSIDKFVVSDDDQRGPRARIYLDGLHNWVQLEQAREIRDSAPEVWQEIYRPTEDSEEALSSPTPWHFGKSQLYMHHFSNMQAAVNELGTLSPLQAHAALRSKLRNADRFYSEIDDALIDLERHGKGEHIQGWLSAINRFAREHLRD